jgi:SAM-dependent methyltransferase
MEYDPIKKGLGVIFKATPFSRMLFYRLLDVLLLRTWHIKRELRTWVKTKGDAVSILDAGSGFGQYEYFLSSLNKHWNIKGIDVKDEQIADCNNFFRQINRTNVRFEMVDLVKFSEVDQYDLIISIEVMEHIQEDVAVMQNLYRALKPGGMLLISTPSDITRHGDDDPFVGEHVRHGYDPKDMEAKLRQAGFSSPRARYTYGIPGNISWHLSMKYPLTMLNRTRLFFSILPLYYAITFPFALLLNLMDVHTRHAGGRGLLVSALKA